MLNIRSQMAALIQKVLESRGSAKLTSHPPALPSLRVCAMCCANRKCSSSMVPQHSHKETQLHTCLQMLYPSLHATHVSTCYTCLHMLCTISTCCTCLHTLYTSLHTTHISTCFIPLHAINLYTHTHMLHTSPYTVHISTI